MDRQAGFSLLELLIAMAVATAVMASAFAVVMPSRAELGVQGEAGDMQQRLRVASETLQRDLAMAGALVRDGPGILPYRVGPLAADAPGAFRSDAISLRFVPSDGAPVETVIYSLKQDDEAGGVGQLVAGDGTHPDVPVVDHVVALAFEYFGEPRPPLLRKPLTDAAGPWTTYGPRPASVALPPYAAGENCVFVVDADGASLPRLPALEAADDSLVRLTPAMLADGPWCPDGASPLRWDADLLRIRAVVATIRVQSAIAALRGPAGSLFARGGTSRGGAAWLPDLEARVRVAPANLNVASE